MKLFHRVKAETFSSKHRALFRLSLLVAGHLAVVGLAGCLQAKDVLWQDRFDAAPTGRLTKVSGDALFAPTVVPTTEATYVNGSIVEDGEGGKLLRHHLPAGELGAFIVPVLLLRETDHAILEYDLRFDPDFDWRWGGKIPGLVGVRAGESIYAPTSGNDDGREKGFSTRLMWHGNDDNGRRPFGLRLPPIRVGGNDMVTYVYARHPNQDFDGFGWHASLGSLERDVWCRVRYEVKLNTPGRRDGVFRVWFNGRPVFSASDWDYRAREDVRIQAILWDIHRGGGVSPGWISTRDCHIDIRNVVVKDLATPSSPDEERRR